MTATPGLGPLEFWWEPGTPEAGAAAWLSAVIGEGDWTKAWVLMAPQFRYDHARRFLRTQDLWESHAASWAQTWAEGRELEGEMWDTFSEQSVEAFRWLIRDLPLPNRWQRLDNQPVEPLHEIVTFLPFPTTDQSTDQLAVVVRFLMVYTDHGWLVLRAMGAQPPNPGASAQAA